mmetsp:Transcript_8668/g.19604  ORF Transcript_8668/g.19604 Transcript_8668/m.19604 type:complete len:130 (+) Transcript_8668:1000-1389(+)
MKHAFYSPIECYIQSVYDGGLLCHQDSLRVMLRYLCIDDGLYQILVDYTIVRGVECCLHGNNELANLASAKAIGGSNDRFELFSIHHVFIDLNVERPLVGQERSCSCHNTCCLRIILGHFLLYKGSVML